MPLRLDRRRFLQASIAGLCLRPAMGRAADAAPLSVRHLWPTDNGRIGPLSEASGRLFYAGDRSIGALSPASGDQLWSHAHGFDSPAVFRPRLTSSLMVTGGRHWLAACDQASGAEIWRYPARIQTGVPLVEEDSVVFGDGHEIVSLDTLTGAEQWRFAGIPDTLAAYAPAASADTIYAGPGDGHLYALDRMTGGLRWSRDISRDWQYLRQITVADGILVAGTYKEILAGLALEDGSRLWSFNAGNFINSQHVAGGAAHLWSPTGWIYAISLESGRVRWRHQTTDYDGSAGNWASVLAEITTRADKLYVLSMDNVLHVLDMEDGREVAARPVPGHIRHAVLPLIDGSGFAFPTTDAEVLLTGAA
ncbi:MAG: PQQ-binding-like beta-propeller repeat protein [Hoeflea sp.]|uniref:outer membrane protein assembly factor BamB family protein n=1 Tax=Hoeflea sp. TaxID=1940281 RepID=UPI001DE3A300|nr:PQQ-binding-like beta-propeller repeat protein [Hoeflea sp.]MBU4530204.1 PQQ-binding-like beta-propeller repeat protein [Alphaproteobacteria bacterium]MBU4542511.1 PQQ-binding-like beta-propeller repeat protein [Alphaproteobacteria bacterium]MBU4551192.1 PQQ-binding-like beta-propeller repeat protein [Alphaproteobacteria bacterium]MBV1723015.1 PQQ-binding-like beta-propeller repeat protein [Hoeflea sp.]MBV1760026.1 PQQ-binding-like beta-propeller repeat protein [Hoeflea sp.]